MSPFPHSLLLSIRCKDMDDDIFYALARNTSRMVRLLTKAWSRNKVRSDNSQHPPSWSSSGENIWSYLWLSGIFRRTQTLHNKGKEKTAPDPQGQYPNCGCLPCQFYGPFFYRTIESPGDTITGMPGPLSEERTQSSHLTVFSPSFRSNCRQQTHRPRSEAVDAAYGLEL